MLGSYHFIYNSTSNFVSLAIQTKASFAAFRVPRRFMIFKLNVEKMHSTSAEAVVAVRSCSYQLHHKVQYLHHITPACASTCND